MQNNERSHNSHKMRLTTVDPLPIFPIRLQSPLDSVYVANVNAQTTGEILLRSFLVRFGYDSKYQSYKLVYHDKDIQFIDTIERLGIRVCVWVCECL